MARGAAAMTTGRGGWGRGRGGTFVRIRGGLLEWLLALLAREFLAPWIVGLVLLPATGQLGHVAFGGSGWRWLILALAVVYAGPTPWPVLRWRGLLTKGAAPVPQWPLLVRRWTWVGLAVWTFGESAPRGVYGRWRVAVSTAFALDAVGITQAFGITTWEGFVDAQGRLRWPVGTVEPWAAIYVVGAFLVCFTWNQRRTEAVRGNGDDQRETDQTPLQKIFKVDKDVDVTAKNRQVTVGEDGKPVSVSVDLRHRGETTEHMQAHVGELASQLDLPREGHLAVPLPRASQTRITLMQRPMLTEPQPWTLDDPYAGDYPDRPARLGLYQTGAPLEMVRFANLDPDDPETPDLGDDRKWLTNNLIIQGAPGTGKTETILTEFSRLITRKALVIWYIDLTKGGQTAVDLLPCIDWYANSPTEAYRMIVALGAYIDWAAGVLGRAGFREWNRRAFEVTGVPALAVHSEEYNSVQPVLGKEITRRSEAMRSVGGSLSLSSQRADATNMDPSLRAMLVMAMCFGLKDASDAAFALSPQTIAAGADPGQWGNMHPGKLYLEASHRPQDWWAIPARAEKPIPPPRLREHAALWAPHMTPLPTGWAESLANGKDKHAAGVGRHYLERQRTDLGEWVETHNVRIPFGQPPAREAITTVPIPVTTPPEADMPAPTPPMTEAQEAEFTRAVDRAETAAKIEAMRDPDVADEIAAADKARARRVDPDRYPDPLAYHLPEPMPDLAEARDAALVKALTRRFADRGNPDAIDVATVDLMTDWIRAGGVGLVDENGRRRRSALMPRLEKLQALGYAEPLPDKGRRGAKVWRVSRRAVQPPPPSSEPDPVPEDDEGGE